MYRKSCVHQPNNFKKDYNAKKHQTINLRYLLFYFFKYYCHNWLRLTTDYLRARRVS